MNEKELKITITEKLEYIASEICDKYCKYPEKVKNFDLLMEICENCPLTKFI